jgi:phospholipid transport system substrate-binding protein
MNVLHKRVLFVSLLLVFCQNAFAFELSASDISGSAVSPYIVIKTVGVKLFSHIADLPQEQRNELAVIRDIVKKQLMPHVDTRYASYKVLGKSLSKFSKQQRKQFVAAMNNDLLNAFTTALANYKDQQVTFEAGKDTSEKRIVSVKVQLSSPDVALYFKCRKNKKSNQWLVFDMVVEGISLLSAKQSEVAGQIRQHGLAGLLERLDLKTT